MAGLCQINSKSMKNIDWRDPDTYLVWVIGTMFFCVPIVSIIAIWGGIESWLAIKIIVTGVTIGLFSAVVLEIRQY